MLRESVALTRAAAARESADIELACARRSKRDLYRAFARTFRRLNPNEPINIDRVRVAARCYAGEIHGWSINDA